MKVTDWMMDSDGIGAFRMVQGGDPENIGHRVAFIEKTPRVRIRPAHFREHRGTYEDGGEYVEYHWAEHLDWAARDFKGSGADDPESRAWCDAMLKLLGYEL